VPEGRENGIIYPEFDFALRLVPFRELPKAENIHVDLGHLEKCRHILEMDSVVVIAEGHVFATGSLEKGVSLHSDTPSAVITKVDNLDWLPLALLFEPMVQALEYLAALRNRRDQDGEQSDHTSADSIHCSSPSTLPKT
jgi:hypothetical protein